MNESPITDTGTRLLNKRYLMSELAEAADKLEEQREAQQASYFLELIRTVFNRPKDGFGSAIMFTGLDRGCGVSYISASIAVELAWREGKVLLADADAIAALTGRQRPLAFCERMEPGRVWVLGMEQVSFERLTAAPRSISSISTLELLRQEFTYLVIDAPAVSASHTALKLASSVQGVVFVAQAAQTEKRRLRETQARFISLGARVLGSVYNARQEV